MKGTLATMAVPIFLAEEARMEQLLNSVQACMFPAGRRRIAWLLIVWEIFMCPAEQLLPILR